MISKSLVRLGALAILWGSGFLFIKEALGGLSPFQIVFGRMLAAAVAMLALTLTTKRRLPTDRRIWVHLAVVLDGSEKRVTPPKMSAWMIAGMSSSASDTRTTGRPL